MIYLGRGQYTNAAIAAVAIIPFGDFSKGLKYTNKITKYEKLADKVGTGAHIKEFHNTSPINTRILFNDMTQGALNKEIINTKNGKIIRATMSDGSMIQLRNFSTKSGPANHTTIEFLDTGAKWKFNF